MTDGSLRKDKQLGNWPSRANNTGVRQNVLCEPMARDKLDQRDKYDTRRVAAKAVTRVRSARAFASAVALDGEPVRALALAETGGPSPPSHGPPDTPATAISLVHGGERRRCRHRRGAQRPGYLRWYRVRPAPALESAAEDLFDLAPFAGILGGQQRDRLTAAAHSSGSTHAVGEPRG